MNVQLIETLAPNALTCVLVVEENIKDVAAQLPAAVAATLQPAAAELRKTTYYLAGEHQYFFFGMGKAADLKPEMLRRALHKAVGFANEQKVATLQILAIFPPAAPECDLLAAALGEIPYLSGYQFLAHKTDKKDAKTLQNVGIKTNLPDGPARIAEAARVAEAVCMARDLVNEPPNVMTATELANRAVAVGERYGFRVEVFEKAKIESLLMGGLLAVNRGSQDPPTFSILEWKPANATNAKPIVLVGKGVTFDTGGLSLKPTAGSMDSMKSDMAGAAAVIGAFEALAANKTPRWVVGLIPATDNRPGLNAYTPNDVVTMYNKTTVEVLNTDAEGRMILADALAFAKQFDPEVVIDLATLTGSAVTAVGVIGIPLYSTTAPERTALMVRSSFRMHERVVEFPLWEEYAEEMKSNVADVKNIGSRYGGSITAAKFLQRFVDYPWMHLDIAGPAFLDTADSYRGKHGTGAGVRLLYDFIRQY